MNNVEEHFAAKHFDAFVKTLDGMVSECPSDSSNAEKLLCLELDPMDFECEKRIKDISLSVDHKLRDQEQEPVSEPCSKGCIAQSNLLVDYSSSSSSSDMEDQYKQYTKPVEDLLSCLIRLHFKLERLETNVDSAGLVKELCENLEMIEEIYES